MKTALGALFTVLFLALCGPSVLGDKSKPKISSAEKKKIVFLAGKKVMAMRRMSTAQVVFSSQNNSTNIWEIP